MSFIVSFAREARAQRETMTVSILRRTAVHTNPSYASPTLAFLNPSTFEVTQLKVDEGFVRLLLRQIDRRSPSSGYGYIAAEDVAVDSAMKAPAVAARRDTASSARAPAGASDRPAPVSVSAPPAVVAATSAAEVPARAEAPTPARVDGAPRAATRSAGGLVVRPESLPASPNGVDSPDLHFMKQGPLAAVLQRPMSVGIGARDSIVVPAGFVAEFASIPRALWSELSPVGEHTRAAIVHDYLYWFQPCEREEADNLLMIAMKEGGVADLQRGAIYAGVRLASGDVWIANRASRDRGDLKIVPTGVNPTAQEAWSDFRARLGKADIRGTRGRMARQGYCEVGKGR